MNAIKQQNGKPHGVSLTSVKQHNV